MRGQKSGGGSAETVGGRASLMQKLEQLHADQPDLPLMISASKDIKYEEVIRTISDAKKLGIERVGLATK